MNFQDTYSQLWIVHKYLYWKHLLLKIKFFFSRNIYVCPIWIFYLILNSHTFTYSANTVWIYPLLRIDSSSSLRSPCLFNLLQLPSQYKQYYPPYSEQQTDQGRSSSISPLWLPLGATRGCTLEHSQHSILFWKRMDPRYWDSKQAYGNIIQFTV